MAELYESDATAQAELVRNGEVSPLELVEHSIQRIEKLNPELNSVIHPLFDKARERAKGELPDGPFKGVPLILKDLDGSSAGDPYHCGMKFLKENAWVDPVSSYNVQKFREAGFIDVGRANTPELGLIPATEGEAYGPTHNPWKIGYSAGGSSGGPAAAVAAGFAPVGSAGDGGGSIRIPASQCGLVGLKPSRGRVSFGPSDGEVWEGLVVKGALTRTVRDAAAVLDVLSGYMPGDPYTAPTPSRPFAREVGEAPGKLRIGFTKKVFLDMAQLHPDCDKAIDGATALLESLGHELEEAHPEGLDRAEMSEGVLAMIGACTAHELDTWSERVGKPIGPDDVEANTWQFAELGRQVSALQYIKAVQDLHAIAREVVEWWHGGYDLLLTSTLPEPPYPLGTYTAPDNPFQGMVRSAQVVPFVAPFNVTGQPAISLPLHWNDEDLPIGIQLVAAMGREDLLIRVAAQLEEAQPWADRRPPIG